MENYISLLIAILVELKQLDEVKAEKLDKELRNSTIPGTYNGARQAIEDVFKKLDNK